MELLLAVLLWVGVITQEEMPYLAENEATELFQINANQIEAEYPEEYGSIIAIYEDEVK